MGPLPPIDGIPQPQVTEVTLLNLPTSANPSQFLASQKAGCQDLAADIDGICIAHRSR
jgi:hypothetical protein